MKKILTLPLLSFLFFFLSERLQAQCTVSGLAIELKSSVPVSGGCLVLFNFSWKQEINSGNKFAYLHLWNASQYPDLLGTGQAYTPTSNYPTATDLAGALATIVIDGNGTSVPVIGTQYHPEITVPVLSSGMLVRKEHIDASWERMTIENIQLILPDCAGSGITGDIWASQADNGKNVHCVSSGIPVFVGNPRVSGLLYCTVPRQYSLQISNLATIDISVSYNIFIDEGDGIYEPALHDLKITSIPVGPVSIAAGETYQSGIQSYLPYSSQKPEADHGLWVEVSTIGILNKTISFVENACIPLPVIFKSFTAQRNGFNVELKWQTAIEQNNMGFEVQRRTGTGNFETLAFVPTRAPGGYSQSELSYVYNDINTSSVVSEYRIRQLDFDRQATYTLIKSIKGVGQRPGILVYPNPSFNGEVHILLDDLNLHDLTLIDMKGRVIKKWEGHVDNNLSVSGLLPGMFILKAVDHLTGRINQQKFVVLGH